jgi:hypothetical protein
MECDPSFEQHIERGSRGVLFNEDGVEGEKKKKKRDRVLISNIWQN